MRVIGATLPVISVLWVGLAATACEAVLGIESLPRGSFTYAEPDCGDCVLSNCAAAESACFDDPECRALFDCLNGCPTSDVDCRAACDAEYGTAFGRLASEALDSCRRVSCVDSCYGTGNFWRAEYDSNDACVSCINSQCRDELRECVGSNQCERGYACTRSCSDPACWVRCFHRVVGNSLVQPARNRECISDNCGLQCGSGTPMECIGQYSWGDEELADATIDYSVRFRLIDATLALVPAEGATVRACGLPTADCVASDEQQIDADGRVILSLPTSAFGWRGRFEVDGQVNGEDLLPLQFYTDRPLRHFEDLHAFNVIPDSLLELLFVGIGERYTPGTGFVTVLPLACDVEFASNVSFDISEGAKTPDTAITTGTGADVQLLNLNPGVWTLTGRLPNGEIFNETEVLVRSRSNTGVYMYPRTR